MNKKPNDAQKDLIENPKGMFLVDAGPGTGKTFTITKRYIHILKEKKVTPEDILLITFTRNAADKMKEKIMNECKQDTKKLREAPINTFHGFCKRIIDGHGFNAPEVIGIKDNITSSTRIIESSVIEKRKFHRFFDQFMGKHKEYDDFYRMVYDRDNLLNLIKSLAAKGIIPTKNGWFRNGEKYLDGDFDSFKKFFEELNTPLEGKRGPKNSLLVKKLNDFGKRKFFSPNSPNLMDIRAEKKIHEKYAEKAFNEERYELKNFIHDVYFEYLIYVLGKNYLNFSFLLLFAYVLLCEDHSLREQISFKYVMMDEFQDTSEIQLKLSLLLSKTKNICVVGDWKQSIYSFRHANVNVIKDFDNRIKRYKKDLNKDFKRVKYDVHPVKKINLKQNYRSTQKIIDFAAKALTVKGSYDEIINPYEIKKQITPLRAAKDYENGHIQLFESENETKAILHKIQEIVNNNDYLLDGNDKIGYKDIAVLTRTRKFGLELQKRALKHGIPASYEGGIELFKTNPSLLLLAWLRIVSYKNSKRGWSVVLEKAGYNLDETKYIIENKKYPENMLRFREKLKNKTDISSLAKSVFDKYNISNGITAKIIEVMENTFNQSYISMAEMINFVEDNIRFGETHEVEKDFKENSVSIKTIHASKGLEYPVVFVSDINHGRFPSRGMDKNRITFKDPLGLRQKKIMNNSLAYTFDNWRSEILFKSLSGDYDEERRLFYVAMTRAKQYLFLSANCNRKSPFFKYLKKEKPELIEPNIQKQKIQVDKNDNPFTVKKIKQKSISKIPVTSLAGPSSGEGKGKEYGTKVHAFAEKYIDGKEVEPKNYDEKNVKKFIDSLKGDLITEVPCFLPVKKNKRKIMLTGVIDLINVNEKNIQLIDFKTAKKKKEDYKKQLSIYYHVLKESFKEKTIGTYIFFTSSGKLKKIQPFKIKKIKELIRI